MGACARNRWCDPTEIKPAQCCIKLVFHLTCVFMCLFENMAPRKIFKPKRDEVTVEWRKVNDDIYYLYSSPNIIGVIQNNKLGGACGTYGRQKTFIRGFGEETRGKETTWKN